MPRRDGSGPMGAGSMTGRGLGLCTGINAARCGIRLGLGLGLGLAFRHGFGRRLAINKASSETQKEALLEQKDVLRNRLEVIDEQLKKL